MTGMFIAPEIKSTGKTTWAMLPGCTECGGGGGKVAGNGNSGPNYVFLAQKKDGEAQFNFLSNRKEEELAYTIQRICPAEAEIAKRSGCHCRHAERAGRRFEDQGG